MANDAAKAKESFISRYRTPSADTTTLLTTMMKNALPMYQAFGDTQVRLLRNADNQAQFLPGYRVYNGSNIRTQSPKSPVNQSCTTTCRPGAHFFPGRLKSTYEDITEEV